MNRYRRKQQQKQPRLRADVPLKLGGGWYQLSDGEKVQGKAVAGRFQDLTNNLAGAGNES